MSSTISGSLADDKVVSFVYENYAGVIGKRRVQIIRYEHAESPFYAGSGPQLIAYDLDKQGERTFRLSNIISWEFPRKSRGTDDRIILQDAITVNEISHMGDDRQIIGAMLASTSIGEETNQLIANMTPEQIRGRLSFLMKHRHGTPFEHGAITMSVHAPIFVWREWHRHRIGFSYNEESGRYKQLSPVFWSPGINRPMMKVEGWKPGRPKFLTVVEWAAEKGVGPEEGLKVYIREQLRNEASYQLAYDMYQSSIDDGIGFEVARSKLPVATYSTCWVTCNPRSLMAFLSLRTHEPESMFPSYPQYEIEVAAREAEKILAKYWPLTYEVFCECKRVAP